MKKYVAISLIVAMFLLNSCSFLGELDKAIGHTTVKGSGNVRSEERQVSGFNAVEMGGIGQLTIRQGETEALTVEAEDNLLPYLLSEVRNERLLLHIPDRVSIQPTKPIRYTLTIKSLNALALSGLGLANIDDLQTGNLAIALSGSGSVDIGRLTANSLTTNVSGLGKLNIAGKVEQQALEISGSGNYQAASLESQQASVKISGVGDCTLWVKNKLDARISGSGKIDYYGKPVVYQYTEGLGKVKSLGEK